MKIVRKIWPILWLAMMLVIATAQLSPVHAQESEEPKLSQILSFGNGIYIFPFVGREFASVLSAFCGAHPELELIGTDQDVIYTSPGGPVSPYLPPYSEVGLTKYHFVYFRPKKKE
jgi:hypothetical protein